MRINVELDCTDLELLEDIANKIYYAMDGCRPFSLEYFVNSEHPRERAILNTAIEIFEMITGDSPDLCDLEDE